ncbi:phage integrase SAM-like domain-containing protein [Hymenobacter sp. ASUV-10]|uniref:Phage integrase SAM-like domain-containing protein n=1 Tax=Hymenobacter aranciens TaxID=3063996 RepID=A0ABT9BCP4_9BACT|nr:phage integrase SAM-like domain-containing protein [Hymenobacter sp. ASUV-10]MDO7876036.1 phage integrase SAM-like domain-containing protein [Hymenobacter sp. ASUV-10]
MEVTRQLLTDRAGKTGLCRIQLTFCWDGQRLRLSSGQKCLPRDWDAKRELLKARPGTYSDTINPVLEHYADAATAAYHASVVAGEPLGKEAMEAEIRRRFLELSRAEAGLPPIPAPPPPPPPTFSEYYDRWLGEQSRSVNLRTGQRLSKTYLDSLANTRAVLQGFAAHTGHELTLAGMDARFYQAFQEYFFQVRGQGLNTFGKHMRALKTFLGWCESNDIAVNSKFHKFQAPDEPTGTDALTQAELLAIAGLDVYTDAGRALVRRHFEAIDEAAAEQPRRRGQRRSQVDEYRILERLRALERARDKFLQCAYLALRISDANRMAPRHIDRAHHLVRLKAGKTQLPCVIPFIDDDVFRPVALIEKYRALQLPTCLPVGLHLEEYLPMVAELVGLTRIALTSKVGRKTFVTLKLAQGVPRTTVMQATGHKTEKSFNRYAGIDEAELVENYRKTARKVKGESPGAAAA